MARDLILENRYPGLQPKVLLLQNESGSCFKEQFRIRTNIRHEPGDLTIIQPAFDLKLGFGSQKGQIFFL
jgi:hypothetical protein